MATASRRGFLRGLVATAAILPVQGPFSLLAERPRAVAVQAIEDGLLTECEYRWRVVGWRYQIVNGRVVDVEWIETEQEASA